jgi:hypothetical protein
VCGDVFIFVFILKRCISFSNVTDCVFFPGMTHVWIAAKSGDTESLQVLIAQGYDINETGGVAKMTPLGIAALEDNYECMSILLDNNADVTATDNDRATALFIFVRQFSERSEIKKLSHGESNILVDISQRMLQMGADASFFRSSDGQSIMSMAIDTGVLALVKLLVKHGADPSAICIFGGRIYTYFPPSTALNYAIVHVNTENSLKLVKLLIDLGADLSIRSGHQTPLAVAIKWVPLGRQNPEDMLRLLFDNQVFLSEETTEPEYEITSQDMNNSRSIPISSVKWLTNFALRNRLPLSAAIIKAEPENRKRKSRLEESRQMRRDTFNVLLHDRPRDESDLSVLPSEVIRKISSLL